MENFHRVGDTSEETRRENGKQGKRESKKRGWQ